MAGSIHTCGFNQLQIKNIHEKYSRKFQKAKLELAACPSNYLHSLYTALSIVSNLGMMYSVPGGLHRFVCECHAILYKGLQHLWISRPGGGGGGWLVSWNQFPADTDYNPPQLYFYSVAKVTAL